MATLFLLISVFLFRYRNFLNFHLIIFIVTLILNLTFEAILEYMSMQADIIFNKS